MSEGEARAQMSGTPSAVVRFMNVFSRLCLIIAGIGLTLIVIINGINVFSRYVLFMALSWAEEGMVFLMIVGVFVGSITVTWEQIHIRIDAMLGMMRPGPRACAEWLAVAITAAVLLPLGWLSWGVVQKLYGFDQRSEALDLPVWIPQATTPFALLLIPVVMALVLLCRSSGPGKPME